MGGGGLALQGVEVSCDEAGVLFLSVTRRRLRLLCAQLGCLSISACSALPAWLGGVKS